MSHYAEATALERSYWEAVGWALQYRIKVYHPGTGWMKALGDLRDEIRTHEQVHRLGAYAPDAPRPRPLFDDHVQAVCTNGHPVTIYGNSPVMCKRGERLRWWGSDFLCHCGAPAYGGRRR